jgi:hypothetical protein
MLSILSSSSVRLFLKTMINSSYYMVDVVQEVNTFLWQNQRGLTSNLTWKRCTLNRLAKVWYKDSIHLLTPT